MDKTKLSAENISLEVSSNNYKQQNFKNFLLNFFNSKKRIILNRINFSLKDGDRLAIVGRNGSGKSSLLKVISNIYLPTEGKIQICGSLASIIEMSLGFDEEFSLIDNIYFALSLKGFDNSLIKRKVEPILKFAELEDFRYEQLKNLSSGMRSRLSFAIGTEFNADILILDEVFAAGDRFFLQKAKNKMLKKIEKAKILLFVSHREDLIRELCNRVIVMEHGKVMFDGSVDKGLKFYSENK